MANDISIDQELCNGCKLCLEVCAFGNYAEVEDGKVRETEGGAECFACGHCAAVCPTGAISHAGMDPAGFHPLDESARLPFDRFIAFLRLRRSRREFKPDPVLREEIEKLLLAAVEAPSSINNQSVLFTAVTDREIIRRISDECVVFMKRMRYMLRSPWMSAIFRLTNRRQYDDLLQFIPLVDCMLGYAEQGRDVITYDAPCLILLHAPKTDMCAALDATYCAENILLAVETLGLGACEIGFVTEPANRGSAIKDLARIPRDHKVFSSIVVGYPRFKYRTNVPKLPPKATFV